MPRLTDIIRRYDERKVAVGVENSRLTQMDLVRALMSGFDLDIDELIALKPLLVKAAVRAANSPGLPIGEILFGQWADGLMTGLLFAEEAAKAESPPVFTVTIAEAKLLTGDLSDHDNDPEKAMPALLELDGRVREWLKEEA